MRPIDPTLTLTQSVFLQINDDCWFATAQLLPQQDLSSPASLIDSNSKLSITQRRSTTLLTQRLAVRLLCQTLLNHLDIQDCLDEQSFPYRLSQGRQFLCFSHSNDHVAVGIHSQHPCGIDIELNEVNWRIVKRFFHPDEIKLLEKLPSPNRNQFGRYLWQIKECLVKVEQTKLIPVLARNLSEILAELIDLDNNQHLALTYPKINSVKMSTHHQGLRGITLGTPIFSQSNCYQVTICPSVHCVIIA